MSKMASQLTAWGFEDGLVPVEDKEEMIPVGASVDVELTVKIGVAEGEEARRRLYWQLLFYDMYAISLACPVPSLSDGLFRCITSMFDRETFIPRSMYSAATLPSLTPDYHALVAEALKSADMPMESSGPATQSESSGMTPAAKDRREMEEERLRVERLFFGMRAR